MPEQTTEGFFYSERNALTRAAAQRILGIVGEQFGPLPSVIDVGCGVGTWLRVAQEMGAHRIRGVEGPWVSGNTAVVVERDLLEIRDLETEWHIRDRFRLGISLEVAEHLSAPAGERLVHELAQACELVLFSAAIPGQQGNGHINEQPPTYWQAHFEKHGFVAIDCVRPVIRDDGSIPWWYRQNVVLFVKSELAESYFQRQGLPHRKRRRPLEMIWLHPAIPRPEPRTAASSSAAISFLSRVGSRLRRFFRS